MKYDVSKKPACEPSRIPYELIADHYGNTLFLVVEWSLLGERRCTKAQAYEYLRYLLAGVLHDVSQGGTQGGTQDGSVTDVPRRRAR